MPVIYYSNLWLQLSWFLDVFEVFTSISQSEAHLHPDTGAIVMRPSHLPLKFGDSQEAEDVLHHMGMHTLASKSMREQGQQAAWTPEQGFFLNDKNECSEVQNSTGCLRITLRTYIYIYTHIIYIYSFIVVQHHFVGRAMAKSCQRQSRHGRTQRLNS